MNWFRKQKRKTAAAMGVCLAIGSISGIAGCGKEENTDSIGKLEKEENQEKIMGRYLEKDISVPEDCKQISDMRCTEDGGIEIAYRNKEARIKVSSSNDDGKTWKEEKDLFEMIDVNKNWEIGAITKLAKDGGVFITATEVKDQNNFVEHYFYISSKGEVHELDLNELMGGYVFQSEFTDAGTLLLSSSSGVKEINPEDGSVVNTYDDGSNVNSFFAVGDKLVSVVDTSIHYYDLKTGKPLEDETPLTKSIASNPANLMVVGMGINNLLFLSGDEMDSLFYVSHDGIYRYVSGGSIVEQVVDGKLNSFASPDISFSSFQKGKDGAFYMAVSDMSQMDASGKIYKYVYSEDTPAVPDVELSVYALTEDPFFVQVATAFQKKYPDIYVKMETGMSGEDAITETDALKALNTEIMAGKGPDILFLDGIPERTYIEKGMLQDLSGILKDADILDNIMEPYQSEDGAIYEMPVKFGIPYVQGRKEDVEKIKDLTSLADVVESHKEEYSKGFLPMQSVIKPRMFLNNLASVNMSAWIKADNTLNTEAVTEFLQQAERIYQSSKSAADEFIKVYEINPEEENNDQIFSQFGIGSTSMIDGGSLLGAGGIYSTFDLASVNSVEIQNENLAGKLWNGQNQNVFVPCKLVGISAKARQKEAAEKFVKFLFSEEGQKTGMSNGLPVRKSVYEDVSYWMGNFKAGETISTAGSYDGMTDQYVELQIRQPGEEVIQSIQELGKTLKQPAKENKIILRAVMDAGVSFMKGESTVEEAVKNAAAQVNLYLSE